MLPEDLALALVVYCIWYLFRRVDQEKSAKAQAKIQFGNPLGQGYADDVGRGSIRPGGIVPPYVLARGLENGLYPEKLLALFGTSGSMSELNARQRDWVWKRMQQYPGFEDYIRALEEREDPKFLLREEERRREAEAQRLRDAREAEREAKRENLNTAVENYNSMIDNIMMNLMPFVRHYKIKEIYLPPAVQIALPGSHATTSIDKIRLVECNDTSGTTLYYIDFGKQLVGTTVVDVRILDQPPFKNASEQLILTNVHHNYSPKMIKVEVFDNIIKDSAKQLFEKNKKSFNRGATARRLGAQLAADLDGANN